MAISTEFLLLLRTMSRCIQVVTDDEPRVLSGLFSALSSSKKADVDPSESCYVYNPTLGMHLLRDARAEWFSGAHKADDSTMSPHDALIKVYKDDPAGRHKVYVFLDAERILTDAHMVRRVLNILTQTTEEIKKVKLLIFVTSRKVVPEKLATYMQVVEDRGQTEPELLSQIEVLQKHMALPAFVPEAVDKLKGLPRYQVDRAVCTSYVQTKGQNVRADPKILGDFRRGLLKQTNLVNDVDVSRFTFDQVGGASRFKAWVHDTRACWTPEGKKFGLKPPKGVLCVGVWGCGKSLSVKAMGKAWGLPVVELEMGRLRSSGVGDTENNLYRALAAIEAVAPCLVWVDEAEKSLSGGASSGQSDAGTTSRAIGILSTWLQETKAEVCFAMTANSLRGLPTEFVNRMDERFFFGLPSEDDRIDVLKIHLGQRGQDASKYNLARLAEASDGMVGREIEQAVGSALIASFNAKKTAMDEDILADILTRKPRILKTLADEVNEVVAWVGYNPEAREGTRARLASEPGSSGLDIVRG